MIGSRPLYDNLGDGALFVAPPSWDSVLRAVEHKLNVALTGPRGIGKTTLLRRVQQFLRDRGTTVVFVDATAVPDALGLASRIRDALRGQPPPVVASAALTADAFRRHTDPVAGASRALAVLLREIGEAPKATVLVDASASADACYGLFGRMRDALWQQDHHWVLALEDADRSTALKPPADAFFDTILPVEPFAVGDLIEMLVKRLDPGASVAHELLDSAATGANGSPREAIKALVDLVVHGRDPSETLDARSRLLDRASRLGRPAGLLMAEVLDRGAVGPSDQDLQQALGVSRARLSQLFKQLETEALVEGAQERPDGPGRPRTVYRPVVPA